MVQVAQRMHKMFVPLIYVVIALFYLIKAAPLIEPETTKYVYGSYSNVHNYHENESNSSGNHVNSSTTTESTPVTTIVANNNETVERLAEKQTEVIRQIVASEQQRHEEKTENREDVLPTSANNVEVTEMAQQFLKNRNHHHSQYTNHQSLSDLGVEDFQKMSLEELKIKCQHLGRLFGTSLLSSSSSGTSDNQQRNPPQAGSLHVQSLPGGHSNNYFYKPNYTGLRPINSFYVTTQRPKTTTYKRPLTSKPSTTQKTTPRTIPPVTHNNNNKIPNNVKYIKLEPVILQKTILNDGRTIYYWHKSLPTAVQISEAPTKFLQPQTVQITPPSSVRTVSLTTTTKAPPTTTHKTTPTLSHSQSTTPAYGYYDFRNFLPSFYAFGGPEPVAEVTTQKTTTTPPTTTTAGTATSDDLSGYEQQMKFVVAVPYEPYGDSVAKGNNGYYDGNSATRKLGDFDQFAYYPRELQPETIKVEVPYVPTFHVIKAIAVPNDSRHGNANQRSALSDVEY